AAEEVAHGALPQALARLAVPARIEIAPVYPTALADVFGGAKLAPNPIVFCTAGFVVTDGTTTGIATAGHCSNTMTYYAPGVTTALSLVAGTEYWDADQDVQVHTSVENEVAAFYWDTAKTSLEYVQGYRSRAQTTVGDYVCHRGEGTGFSCGFVQSTSYAPNPPGGCNGQTCDPVYVRLEPGGLDLKCKPGDSGGPAFNESVAYGLLVGGAPNPATGQCYSVYYTSLDFLPPGWSLAYY
ncbi:MAG TPA: S1 family peptidase, partial [Thermoanaerobaculia bacterium]|nr:S1 family peptidase [Thermoanaerobaculia bacterium]